MKERIECLEATPLKVPSSKHLQTKILNPFEKKLIKSNKKVGSFCLRMKRAWSGDGGGEEVLDLRGLREWRYGLGERVEVWVRVQPVWC